MQGEKGYFQKDRNSCAPVVERVVVGADIIPEHAR